MILNTWKNIGTDSDFSIYNLPWGIFSVDGGAERVGVAIGDEVIDMAKFADLGILADMDIPVKVWESKFLNDFVSLGKEITNEVRLRVQQQLCDSDSLLAKNPSVFISMNQVQMHLPVDIRDYTDFYSSIEHAYNVGVMFRDPENALLPNWKHLPVGYHGRASSIVVSGTPIKRPYGQTKPADGPPEYGPSRRLDFELEMGFVVGKSTKLGEQVAVNKAKEYIFGLALFNDWSARDIQKWEYVPLGPFLGKSFASSISPWIVTIEALEILKTSGPVQEPSVLPYLKSEGENNYDINLEVAIASDSGSEDIVSRSNFKYMYWNMCQQLAHHTVNGCNINIGDLMASGTISGKDPSSYGSMLEISWAGKKPLMMSDGSTRVFLNDGDTVVMKGFGVADDKRIGFGEVSGKILP